MADSPKPKTKAEPSKWVTAKPQADPVIEKRNRLWQALHKFIRDNGGWIVSSPGSISTRSVAAFASKRAKVRGSNRSTIPPRWRRYAARSTMYLRIEIPERSALPAKIELGTGHFMSDLAHGSCRTPRPRRPPRIPRALPLFAITLDGSRSMLSKSKSHEGRMPRRFQFGSGEMKGPPTEAASAQCSQRETVSSVRYSPCRRSLPACHQGYSRS